MSSGATVYRYELTRTWPAALGASGSVLWVMLNPSTADATTDDPTIRRCIRFTRDWGYSTLTVVNLFAMRATIPADLRKAHDPIGPHNDRTLAVQAHTGGHQLIVAAWGAYSLWDRDVNVLRGPLSGARLHCLGHTKGGAPRHPLYVKADTKLEIFRPGIPRQWVDVVDDTIQMFKEVQ